MNKKEVLMSILEDNKFDGDIMVIRKDEIEELLTLIVELLPDMDSDKVEPVAHLIRFMNRRSLTSIHGMLAIRKKTLENIILLMEK